LITYAEVHYRPWGVPSLIYMKMPEIVFDAPTRVEPGQPIPVFIFIKDADQYPVRLESIIIHAVYEGGTERIARFPYDGLTVDSQIWWDSINIVPEYTGTVRIEPCALLRKGKKIVTVCVDNYKGLLHSPLIVHAASLPFPGAEGWYHGDIHCHTYFTSDQIEFGAPLEAMTRAADSMGLDWIAATDHSYDLDDKESDYFSEDPLLTKWKLLNNISNSLEPVFTVIPGEEVTCKTSKGKNCHMLALNSERFIKGSGDGGERGLDTATEKTIGEAAAACIEWGGIACAAHPMESVPLLERLFLNRGKWSHTDLKTPGIKALQIHNGVNDSGFKEGMKAWISLLLNGHKIFAFGGNDAHGDFNRRRAIKIPFFSMHETRSHIFGNVRTIVLARSNSKKDIIDALKKGCAVVSNGPFIDLSITSNGAAGRPGNILKQGTCIIHVHFQSTSEFGSLKSGILYAGALGGKKEHTVVKVNDFKNDFKHLCECTFESKDCIYLRAECETVSGKLCFTNPVWIE